MKSIIYAASDASFIEIDSTKFRVPPASFAQSGKVYRRLTPEYWAWFHHKLEIMGHALIQGKISERTYVEILDRISNIYNVAHDTFGKKMLDDAVRTTDVRKLDEIINNENAAQNDTQRHNSHKHDPHRRDSQKCAPQDCAPRLIVERGR